MSAIIIYDLLFFIFFLCKLFVIHTILCCKNLSYYEYIKKKFKVKPGFNPFDVNFCHNLRNIFCKLASKSMFFELPYFFKHNQNEDKSAKNLDTNGIIFINRTKIGKRNNNNYITEKMM